MTDHFTGLVRALRAALTGDRPPIEVRADGSVVDRSDVLHRFPDAGVVVRTSGSTGTPKQTVLSAAALRASADATAERLGVTGQWLLTLPVNYVAGLAVLTRSLFAHQEPVAMAAEHFTAVAFTRAVLKLSGPRRLTSLVPTQLQRVLADPTATAAAASFDAILVGGAAVHEHLYEHATREGLKIVRTYGMAETCGGCVYDGRPLPGVQVRLDESQRVLLSGPMLAEGYLDPELTAERFIRIDGARFYRTDDYGQLENNVLRVTGRVDDVINTGGIKVSAASIQAVLAQHTAAEVVVVGVPDPLWGSRVCAAVEDPGVATAELGRLVATQLGPAAAPKSWLCVDALPRVSTGKVDRVRLRQMFQEG